MTLLTLSHVPNIFNLISSAHTSSLDSSSKVDNIQFTARSYSGKQQKYSNFVFITCLLQKAKWPWLILVQSKLVFHFIYMDCLALWKMGKQQLKRCRIFPISFPQLRSSWWTWLELGMGQYGYESSGKFTYTHPSSICKEIQCYWLFAL